MLFLELRSWIDFWFFYFLNNTRSFCFLTSQFLCLFVFSCPPQRDDGECGSVQRPGVLSSSQTAEHQESGQMVPHLEGQAQVINLRIHRQDQAIDLFYFGFNLIPGSFYFYLTPCKFITLIVAKWTSCMSFPLSLYYWSFYLNDKCFQAYFHDKRIHNKSGIVGQIFS